MSSNNAPIVVHSIGGKVYIVITPIKVMRFFIITLEYEFINRKECNLVYFFVAGYFLNLAGPIK